MNQTLVEGWSVQHLPNGLRLERGTLDDRRLARRRLITALGSAMTAVALTLGGLDAPTGIGLIVWPLVGLFLLVAGLGVWAWQQARLAIARPLFLEVQGAPVRRVVGVRDEPAEPLEAAFDDIAAVELVQEPGLTVPVVRLYLMTNAGLFFAGPQLILASDEARARISALTALAQALGTYIGCEVKTLDAQKNEP